MPRAIRCIRRLRFQVVCLIAILAMFWQQYSYHIYRNALAAKYSPTEFKMNVEDLQTQVTWPNDETLRFQNNLIANHADWRPLGEGWEGKTFVYHDSVIKTFTPSQSPFRNCARSMALGKWPTEIPASVLYGGIYHNPGLEPSIYNATHGLKGFLPVKAYFKAPSLSTSAEWHLVTPFLAEGSLKKFAKRISKEQRNHRNVDTQYRPLFNRLLHDLRHLHDAGYCHDDIKPENIFVKDDSNWILGDLGYLRHISHPYHTSLLWRENRQLDDCRANDVVRLLKSYIWFIQASANDKRAMNAEFSDYNGPLSRLFSWALSRNSRINARELYERSHIEPSIPLATTQVAEDFQATSISNPRPGLLAFHRGRQSSIDNMVEMSVNERKARWWSIVRLFGVPHSVSCGN